MLVAAHVGQPVQSGVLYSYLSECLEFSTIKFKQAQVSKNLSNSTNFFFKKPNKLFAYSMPTTVLILT